MSAIARTKRVDRIGEHFLFCDQSVTANTSAAAAAFRGCWKGREVLVNQGEGRTDQGERCGTNESCLSHTKEFRQSNSSNHSCKSFSSSSGIANLISDFWRLSLLSFADHCLSALYVCEQSVPVIEKTVITIIIKKGMRVRELAHFFVVA